ncbi:MAG: hypothetical protein V3T52_00660 [Thermodesulfobacteriota bacterium]
MLSAKKLPFRGVVKSKVLLVGGMSIEENQQYGKRLAQGVNGEYGNVCFVIFLF